LIVASTAVSGAEDVCIRGIVGMSMCPVAIWTPDDELVVIVELDVLEEEGKHSA
jgi:hypothetical protein